MLSRPNHVAITLTGLVWILFVREITAGQLFSFGVKASIGLTNTVDVSYGNTSADKRYTVGPTIEVGLPFSFAVEVSALYRRTGFDTSTGLANNFSQRRVRANSWEIPILVKYYIPLEHSPLRLHLSAGYALRITGIRRGSSIRAEDQLLHPPVQQLRDVKFILRGACDFVNPSELLELPA